MALTVNTQDRQNTYNVTLRLFRATFVAVDKEEFRRSVSAALGIQHVKRMRRIVLSSVACPAILYSLSHERHDFRVKSY